MGLFLVFGMFVIGFFAAEFMAAVAKQPVGLGANLFCGLGFACVGVWVAFK